jgi:hypothetical protein
MGIQKSWKASYAFRKFRLKTNQISKIYWLQQLGLNLIEEKLKSLKPNDLFIENMPIAHFDAKMYPYNVTETSEDCKVFMDRNRLYLLVIYTAFLESYLKEITIFYLAASGYIANPDEKSDSIRLNPIGKALGAPILDRSSVPEMIKYAAQLFEIDFGKDADEWSKIYKIRCEVAHNGGVATPNFLKQMSGFAFENDPKASEMFGISWEELRKIMRISDEIAAKIDSKINFNKMSDWEIDQIFRELFVFKKLPPKKEVWHFIFENYGLKTNNHKKMELERRYYL